MYSRNFLLLFLISLFFLIGCESDSKTHYKNAVNQHMSKINQNTFKKSDFDKLSRDNNVVIQKILINSINDDK